MLIRALAFAAALAGSAAFAGGPLSYPRSIDPTCRTGDARLFDECASQAEVLANATQAAHENGKILLVSYGAEWCIWCHVFDGYLVGRHGNHFYAFMMDDGPLVGTLREHSGAAEAEQAAALAAFARKHFVVAHIENRYAPDGRDVLRDLGAEPHFDGGVPFNFVVAKGRLVAALPGTHQLPELEVRREGDDWYRGYDRVVLLRELRKLVDAVNAERGA